MISIDHQLALTKILLSLSEQLLVSQTRLVLWASYTIFHIWQFGGRLAFSP